MEETERNINIRTNLNSVLPDSIKIVLGVCAVFLLVVFVPKFFIYGEKFNIVCQMKLRGLYNAFYAYQQDNDSHWPDAENWCDQIKNYLEKDYYYKCLKDHKGPCSYAMNKSFPSEKMSMPDDFVLLFESKSSGWNMSGGSNDLCLDRHKQDGTEGCIILFADGGAKFVRIEEIPNLKWNLDEFEEITNDKLEMEQFTKDYADAIRAQLPEAQITITHPLELVFTVEGDETKHRCHLNNVWQLCKSSPQDKASIINHYVESLVKHIMPGSTEGPVDPNSIIPSFKNELYLNSLPLDPDGSIPVAAEHLAGDIWITYARESEATIHFLSESDLQDLKMSMPEVREQSIINLKNRLNEVLKFGEGPCHVILTDGGYTASLLLLDSLWEKEEKLIAGEIVASVPSRDTLFFTSTESAEGIEAIRKTIAEVSKEEAYPISNTLLVRRNGKWEVFEQDKSNTP